MGFFTPKTNIYAEKCLFSESVFKKSTIVSVQSASRFYSSTSKQEWQMYS